MGAARSWVNRIGSCCGLPALLAAAPSMWALACTDETPVASPMAQGNSGADAGDQGPPPGPQSAPSDRDTDTPPASAQPPVNPPGASPTRGDAGGSPTPVDASTGGHAGDGDGDGDGDGVGDAGTGRPPVAAHCEPPSNYGPPLPAGALQASTITGGPAFLFLEGPLWLADAGVLLFSEMDFGGASGNGPPSKIHRFRPPGAFDVFVASSGSNGLALDLGGDVLAGTHDEQSVSAFAYPSGNRSTLADDPPGAATTFNSPNDLTIRSDGTIYFSDPSWQRDGRTGTGTVTGVYRRAPNGVVSLEDDSLDRPNGITLSPDEGALYVSAADGNVYRYVVAADGGIGSRTLFASPGSGDGMTVDCAGNLYLAAGVGRVFVYGPSGTALGAIEAAPSTTNVAFGGAERRTLFITANAKLMSIELNVPGLPF